MGISPLILGKRPEEELYQIEKDPGCMTMLPPILNMPLYWTNSAQGDPQTLGHGDVFDLYPHIGKIFEYQMINKPCW